MINEKERGKLIKFIYSREKPEGGFSFSQTTPPTLEDTYFALQLLEEIKRCSVSRRTVSYIHSLNLSGLRHPKHLYQIANIYRIACLSECTKILRENIPNKDDITLNTLADLYYMVLTKELFNIPVALTKNEQNILTSVQVRRVKTMEECEQLITLMKKLNISFQSQEYAHEIQTSQNADGGFGIVPHSTSFLEPTYHALQALKELHTSPNNIPLCERFVYLCMTKVGGFGRQSITVPSLEYSYYAVISLKIIDMMKKSI